MKDDHVGEIGSAGLQHSGRRLVAIDLAITFVGEDEEAKTSREICKPLEIGAVGNGALGVRGRCYVAGDRTRQQRLIESIEIGQEPALARRRQIDRLAICRECAGGVGGIKRIWNEDSRPARATRDPAFCSDRCKEQALACAVEHQHFIFGIDRACELVAAAEPVGDRAAKRFDAFVGGIATEVGEMRVKRRADEVRNWVLWLADREINDRLAGLDAGNERGEPHEG